MVFLLYLSHAPNRCGGVTRCLELEHSALLCPVLAMSAPAGGDRWLSELPIQVRPSVKNPNDLKLGFVRLVDNDMLPHPVAAHPRSILRSGGPEIRKSHEFGKYL